MPVYYCKNCGFIFKREKETDTCPDCGKRDIRPALEPEIMELKARQEKRE